MSAPEKAHKKHQYELFEFCSGYEILYTIQKRGS